MNKEEAIKIVKSHYPTNKQMLNEALEFLIPELKVSEDELTWLINYISEEAYSLSIDIRDDEDRRILKKLQKSLAWLKKQCKNNKGISESTKQKLEDNLNKALEKETPESWNEFLDKQSDQRHEWSEEDATRLQRIIDFLWYNRKGDTDTIYQQEQDIDWLKSLKDRIQPPSEQEWSDEDENGLEDALWAVKQARTIAKDENDMGTLWYAEKWLNTIKERVQSKQDESKPTQRKDFISIPFGAFDSELVNETITIPDGYVATIEGNKIHIKREGNSTTEAIKEEKVDNTNKAEPKFKVGDFIVYNDDGCICQIKSIRENNYCIWPLDSDVEGWLEITDIDNKCHLWTIQDAQNGDILVSSINKPFIYNGWYNDSTIGAYCGFNRISAFTIADNKYNWTENKNIRPAIKKQCKTLFDEMKLLGWVWNPETKELNRLDK